jgi:hypothetical protein
MFMVKIRAPGAKTFHFITPKAGLTRLRLHAMMLSSERAEAYAAELRASNPGAQVTVVPAFGKEDQRVHNRSCGY